MKIELTYDEITELNLWLDLIAPVALNNEQLRP